MRNKATCHQDQPNQAFGLCSKCYQAKRYKDGYRQCKKARRKAWLNSQYGLTEDQFNELLKNQENLCALCKQELSSPYVDHSHITGHVRGLLCRKCNLDLGIFEKLQANPYLGSYLKHRSGDSPRVVCVLWRDAQDFSKAWIDQDEAKEFGEQDCTITSVGFLVSQTPKYITLAADWHQEEKDFGRVTKIPVGMIVEIQDIGPLTKSQPVPLESPETESIEVETQKA